jgi:hypothetical protein
MKPGNDDEKQQQQGEAKGPPTAPLPPPAYYQEGRANTAASSSSSSSQQQQYPRIPALPDEHQHRHHQHFNNNWDPEAAAAAEFAAQFAEAEARGAFVVRVLSIVSAQLVLTAGMTMLFFYSRGARSFLIANAWTVPVSWVVGFAVSTTVRRREKHFFISSGERERESE